MSTIQLIDISPKLQGTPIVRGEVQSSRRRCMRTLTKLRQAAQRIIPDLRREYATKGRLKKQGLLDGFLQDTSNIGDAISKLEQARMIVGSKLIDGLILADGLLSVEEFCQACDLEIYRVKEALAEWAPWNGSQTRYLWLINYWGIEWEADYLEYGAMSECISAVIK